MKTTSMEKTELKDVYCVPKTEEEWGRFNINHNRAIIGVCFNGHPDYRCLEPIYRKGRLTEIPVSKFFDLLEDRIAGWRLEEIGFRDMPTISNKGRWMLRLENGMNIIIFEEMIPFLDVSYNELKKLNIKTFTELETLIRFLKQ